ncbi:hypothetical protein [Streptomyces flavalbus]|uniref:Butirosin biosynthesis protein H N-terminal domain-containing protein n=1 Tax=Streptomyces flavalbus TaxID=2665155 RepID=A0ABW2VZP6_9ACTN
MFLTDGELAAMPELSCYTTNLLAYLMPEVPDVRLRLARGVRLAVRLDLPPGELAFSHHPRVDTTDDGRELAYRSAADWPTARAALLDQLGRDGRVLVVGNTRHLPWAPGHGRSDAPHWLLVGDHRDGRWLLADHFTALTPLGDQEPWLGWVDDAQLRTALTLPPRPPREVTRRDELALGRTIAVPPADHHRWLAWQTATTGPSAPGPGVWSLDLEPSLARISATFRAEPAALARHADDLWAAARHHTYRLAYAVTEGALSPERAAAASVAWGELPKTLRFAERSAARGRPRPGVVDRSIDQLLTAQAALAADLSPKDWSNQPGETR